ncbi:Uncharacterised protein [Mycobacteroides abscessus subsp. abscessus]|nr:Uncharacterised protein [Mycobacteroides abscessus subsp. abscessus]
MGAVATDPGRLQQRAESFDGVAESFARHEGFGPCDDGFRSGLGDRRPVVEVIGRDHFSGSFKRISVWFKGFRPLGQYGVGVSVERLTDRAPLLVLGGAV